MKTKTEKFGWVNEMGTKSGMKFDTKSDAARMGLLKNPLAKKFIYVMSSTGRYIGTAEGISFHVTR